VSKVDLRKIYCYPCSQFGLWHELVGGSCPSCASVDGVCSGCGQLIPKGITECPRCASVGPSAAVVVRETSSRGEVVRLPDLPPLPVLVPTAPPVVERYQAGRLGVEAEVTIPAGDVDIMNDLLTLVGVLHKVAAKATRFVGHTDHTRKMIRDMRVLATDIQEEVETRRGPG